MITALSPYPAYKDSGVQWLGKVPEHWEVSPGRMVFREIIDRGHPDEQLLSVTITRGVLRQADLLADSSKKDSSNEDKSNYKLVQPGDLVYNKMRAWQGAVGVSAYRGIVSPAYIVQRLRSAENLPRYIHFLLRTPLFASEAERWSYGITSDQWSLRAEEFKCIYFSLPPLPEQTAIVRFLDYMDRRIRGPIRAKQKLIKLLEEYRQALIHQAVTGKIDVRTGQPYPSYKDSGVAWLGKVPEHWEVVPLRWFISIASGDFIETSAVSGNRSNERPYPVIGGNGVLGYAGLYNATEITVVVGRVGALCGNVHIVNEPAWITDNALMITQIIEFSPKFLSIQLKVMDLNRLANANAQPLVTGGMIKAQRVVKPLIHEQLAIVDFVDEQTAKLDAAIAAARREIELLREYRERLIADVVTGKVDVREVAAQLPDEPPDQEAGTEEEEPVADELATVDSQEESNGEE
jgi:type I restriction enzyme S subunit